MQTRNFHPNVATIPSASSLDLSSSPNQHILATPRESKQGRRSTRFKQPDQSYPSPKQVAHHPSRHVTLPLATPGSAGLVVKDVHFGHEEVDHMAAHRSNSAGRQRPHDMRLRESHFGHPSSTPIRPPESSSFQPGATPATSAPRNIHHSRPSLDDVIQKSTDRTRAWAETAPDDTSSDEDYEPLPTHLPSHRTPSASRSSAAALLPSPLPDHAASMPTPGSAPRHGIMDHFLAGHGARADSEHSSDGPVERRVASTSRQTIQHQELPSSPPPSRPSLGLLDSPDVKRLLESELNELQSRNSPRARGRDLTMADAFRSPSQRHRETIFGGESSPALSSGKRGRDLFQSGDIMSVKRSRWTGEELDSPTPSVGSYSTQTQIDSSPETAHHGFHASPGIHPASAPDLYYGTKPTSLSPESSQGSHSDYHPHSSPAVRSFSANTAAAPSRKKSALKRSDTAPSGSISHAKPSYSYAALIGQAIMQAEGMRISLADIYSFIMARYPYYKKEDAGWQNSIRHNLSLNECFVKTARAQNNPGKGCLWAIAAGCEGQFVDGGFIKKGGTTAKKARQSQTANGRAAQSPPVDSNGMLRPPTQRRGRSTASPDPSTGRASPALSNMSHSDSGRLSPAVSHADSYTPPTTAMSMSRMTSFEDSQSAHVGGQAMARRYSNISQMSDASSMADPVREREPHHIVVTVSRHADMPGHYVQQQPHPQSRPHAVFSRPRQESNARQASETSPTIASPPTNVYMQLAGPYQPMAPGQSSPQNYRALALLASPEAVGIVPGPHAHRAAQQPTEGPNQAFLPAPHIFPKPSRGRPRTPSDEPDTDSPPLSSEISPSSPIHIQSPVSSVRGGAQPSSQAVSAPDTKNEQQQPGDPEKKRVRSHLPSVAALADAASTFDTPRHHIRSPSARTIHIGANGQSHLGTPRRGPWTSPGMHFASPGLHGGAQTAAHAEGWSHWSDPYGGGVEAELEHLDRSRHRRGDSLTFASGGSTSAGPRMYWPSPGGLPSTGNNPLGW